jgi:pimeloyl-ACP methyl ester carboxylesterase
MAHGLGGTRNMRLPAFAERFVAAGYACLLFDYRHWGQSEGEPRQIIDIRKQLEDWAAAVTYARSMDCIDANRVILWGSSFSGGHVLSTAADDSRVAAVISQCLFSDGLASVLAINPITSIKLTALGIMDRVCSLFSANPIFVPLVGRPGETALMTAPDAYDGYLNLASPGVTINNYAAARIALDIVRYYPGRKAAQVQVPVLYCICSDDSVTPAKQTLRHVSRSPQKEIKLYEYGHFDIYVGDAFEHVIRDQLDFLRRKVPTNKTMSEKQ